MKLTGTVVFKDLETGVWVLEGDDGRTYELAGGDRKIKKNGQRIEAEGDVERSGASIAMVGPVFAVKRYKAL